MTVETRKKSLIIYFFMMHAVFYLHHILSYHLILSCLVSFLTVQTSTLDTHFQVYELTHLYTYMCDEYTTNTIQFPNICYFNYEYVFLCVHVCHMNTYILRHQKSVSDLELELQMVVFYVMCVGPLQEESVLLINKPIQLASPAPILISQIQ